MDIEPLVGAFARAANLLKRLVLSVLSDNPTTIAEASRDAARITESLKGISETWVRGNAPKQYISGHREAGGNAERIEDLDEKLRASLSVQIVSLTSRLLSASDAMRDDSLGKLRHAAHLRLKSVLLGEQGIGQAGSEFRDEIERDGVTLRDRLGRKIKPDDYAEVVLITNSATLLNNGTLETATQLGAPGVRVRDGLDHDEECRTANGQAWGLSFAMRNLMAHPRCRRSFAVLASSFSEELDRE